MRKELLKIYIETVKLSREYNRARAKDYNRLEKLEMQIIGNINKCFRNYTSLIVDFGYQGQIIEVKMLSKKHNIYIYETWI